MYCDIVQAIMFELEATDLVVATYESEKVNGSDINTARAEDEGTDESILGKVFDKPDDAYNFYNDYAFLHGFGIRKDDTLKTRQQMKLIGRCMYATKKVSNGWKRMLQLEMKKNGVETLEPDAKQCFELQNKRTGSGNILLLWGKSEINLGLGTKSENILLFWAQSEKILLLWGKS
ncbi:hypothetical protein LXL04_035013 [Taraxacum kok-saghyz]